VPDVTAVVVGAVYVGEAYPVIPEPGIVEYPPVV
jgi:hypothetical protein